MSDAPKIDAETQALSDKNAKLLELVNHHGWKEARKMIVEKVLELQNVAEYADIIQTGNATALLKQMKANKLAAEIIFSWLREVEGGAQTAVENKPLKKKGFIVKYDDQGNEIE